MLKHIKPLWLGAIACLILLVAPISMVFANSLLDQLKAGYGATSNRATRFLPVEQAFSVTSVRTKNQVEIHFGITPEHYIYKDKVKLQTEDGKVFKDITFSAEPSFVNDPDFGNVPVFESDVTAIVKNTPVQGVLKIKWQGCAKAGLCYPPQTTMVPVPTLQQGLPEVRPEGQLSQTQNIYRQPQGQPFVDNQINHNLKDAMPNNALQGSGLLDAAKSLGVYPANEADLYTELLYAGILTSFDQNTYSSQYLNWGGHGVATTLVDKTVTTRSHSDCITVKKQEDNDPFGLLTHPILALGAIFAAGLLLAFSPCILPMLPIVANVVARQHRHSALHGFMLALLYVVGMAASYAIVGATVAVFGTQFNIIAWLQNPWLISVFVVIFSLLGLQALDVIHLHLPHVVSNRLNAISHSGQNLGAGSFVGSFLAGFASALVVSPCVSAPLAALLLSVSTVGQAALGALALFVFGLGLGLPLLILGATEGKVLPKAGNWSNWVRKLFGLALFAIALTMLSRIVHHPILLCLWAMYWLMVAWWLWHTSQPYMWWVARVLAICCVAWSVVLFSNAARGHNNPWAPWEDVNQSQYIKITSMSQLQPILQKHPQVLVDVTADWCIACKRVEQSLFKNPSPVLNNWTVVKMDVSNNTADSQEVYQTLQLFGPPTLLFYSNGKEINRFEGEVDRATFEAQLQQCINSF